LDAEWADKVVIADDKDIPRQLKYFLDHPKEREARIEKAYRHSKEHYDMKSWLQNSTFLGQYMHGGKAK
jgi:spore maturation protein CgeB